MRKVCILSVGSTSFGKHEKTSRELALEAAAEAVRAAEIEPKTVEAGFIANAFGLSDRQVHLGPAVMTGLGIPDAPATTVEAACSSGAAAFREAYLNIAAGIYDVMLAVGTERIAHVGTQRATTYFSYGSDFAFEGSCGASFPGLYAVMARAHMNKYGTTEEQMALVAVKNHKNAFMNPKAHFHKEITVEDVLKSPMVASPLKLLDCCPFSDGAAAAVLCSEETARKRGGPLVYVLASGRSGGTSALHLGEEPTSLRSARLAAGQAFNQCNLTPRDIDVAEVHDCFTIAEIVALEDVGFAKPGEGSHLVEEGRTALTGDIPVNTSGGLKAKGHPIGATGIGQIAELYLQLTGKAGPRQVKDAKTALAHNVGATGGSCAVHILQSG